MSGREPILTIAAIVRNQLGTIAGFHARLAAEFAGITGPVDILYVDDGSSDGTAQVLRDIARRDPRVRVLRLSRYFGEHGSLSAALAHAPGDATILLPDTDAPLSVIPALIGHWRNGCELVWAIRASEPRGEDGDWRARLASALAGRLKLPMVDEMEAALFSRRVVEIYRSLPYRYAHVPSTLCSYGFRQARVEVPADGRTRQPRAGSEILRTLGDRVVDSSMMPVRLVSGIGAILGVVAFIYSLVIIVRSIFFGLGDYGWTSQAVTLLFLGSAQMISLGIIVEYIWRIFQQTRQEPRYIIKERLGVPARTPSASWILDPHDLDPTSVDRSGEAQL